MINWLRKKVMCWKLELSSLISGVNEYFYTDSKILQDGRSKTDIGSKLAEARKYSCKKKRFSS